MSGNIDQIIGRLRRQDISYIFIVHGDMIFNAVTFGDDLKSYNIQDKINIINSAVGEGIFQKNKNYIKSLIYVNCVRLLF